MHTKCMLLKNKEDIEFYRFQIQVQSISSFCNIGRHIDIYKDNHMSWGNT